MMTWDDYKRDHSVSDIDAGVLEHIVEQDREIARLQRELDVAIDQVWRLVGQRDAAEAQIAEMRTALEMALEQEADRSILAPWMPVARLLVSPPMMSEEETPYALPGDSAEGTK